MPSVTPPGIAAIVVSMASAFGPFFAAAAGVLRAAASTSQTLETVAVASTVCSVGLKLTAFFFFFFFGGATVSL